MFLYVSNFQKVEDSLHVLQLPPVVQSIKLYRKVFFFFRNSFQPPTPCTISDGFSIPACRRDLFDVNVWIVLGIVKVVSEKPDRRLHLRILFPVEKNEIK